jgi:hypothetical protein
MSRAGHLYQCALTFLTAVAFGCDALKVAVLNPEVHKVALLNVGVACKGPISLFSRARFANARLARR